MDNSNGLEEERSFSEREQFDWNNRTPLQPTFYKGVGGKNGALRLVLIPAYSETEKNRKYKKHIEYGYIRMEAAETLSANVYDWNKDTGKNGKFILNLTITDCGKIATFLRNPKSQEFEKTNGICEIVHDPKAGTLEKNKIKKYLHIKKSDQAPGNFLFEITVLEDRNKKVHFMVPIAPSEAFIISSLIESAFPKMLAWD
jgi:hypothetical protein